MNKIVLLDTCILGMVTHPNDSPDNVRCRTWAEELRRKGTIVRVPEIADYELRRELIRAYKNEGLAELDRFIQVYGFVSLCTDAMRWAAQYWADAHRMIGRTASDDPKLDGDMILCGQAKVLESEEDLPVIVATSNIRHFAAFVTAEEWEEIDP